MRNVDGSSALAALAGTDDRTPRRGRGAASLAWCQTCVGASAIEGAFFVISFFELCCIDSVRETLGVSAPVGQPAGCDSGCDRGPSSQAHAGAAYCAWFGRRSSPMPARLAGRLNRPDSRPNGGERSGCGGRPMRSEAAAMPGYPRRSSTLAGSGHAVADAAHVAHVGRSGRVVAQLAAETPDDRACQRRSRGAACPTPGAAASRTSRPALRWSRADGAPRTRCWRGIWRRSAASNPVFRRRPSPPSPSLWN